MTDSSSSRSPTHILGISAYYHDSAACLLRDGTIVAAASEERFTRRKGDASFPTNAVAYCLHRAGITTADLDYVGFYDKPLLKLERILETYLDVAPRGIRQFLYSGPAWTGEKLFLDRRLREGLGDEETRFQGRVLYAEHHESHAASAFYPSPFEEAAILTMDGVGEWATASIGVGHARRVELLHELRWPDSPGLLYSAFTHFLGFEVNSGEYKVMGLAPYGDPRYVDVILDELIDLRADGSFTMNREYFGYLTGLRMTNDRFARLFGGPPREPGSAITSREVDLARSIQEVCEEVMLRMARTARRETGLTRLCLAGGVALNCVGNGRILREGPFEDIWIQPAAGDAGGSLGVAELIWHRHLDRPRQVGRGTDQMQGTYLGPDFPDDEIERRLGALGARWQRMEAAPKLSRVASLLAEGEVVGWFDGRMEFGPRALGARSILADPRDTNMQETLNRKIKFRESFRPFAPSILRERVDEYFDLSVESPYMLLVAPLRADRPHSTLPAVTHVDRSARIQTVTPESNPAFHALLRAFEAKTGCPVLVNTSFNVRGEPIVCTPEDAYRCFMRTDMDHLVIGPFLMSKPEQPPLTETGSDGQGEHRRPMRAAEGRKFALTLAGAFALLAAVLFWRDSATAAAVVGAGSALLALAGILVPRRLGPLHRAWMGLALLLSRITTPFVMGLVYLTVITPIGVAMRIAGHAPLAREPDGDSFWVPRATDPKPRSDLERQF